MEENKSCLRSEHAAAINIIENTVFFLIIESPGISPGAGIGNNRHKINEETMNVPVIAIGVPTVVDAAVIVSGCMEETLSKQGFSDNEIQIFLESIAGNSTKNLFVTPKDIDEQVRWIGKLVSRGINSFFEN